MLPCYMAGDDPGLVPLLPEESIQLRYWISTRRELHKPCGCACCGTTWCNCVNGNRACCSAPTPLGTAPKGTLGSTDRPGIRNRQGCLQPAFRSVDQGDASTQTMGNGVDDCQPQSRALGVTTTVEAFEHTCAIRFVDTRSLIQDASSA